MLARYDLAAAERTLTLDALRTRPRTMWRYEEVLPGASPVTLGEGMTPLIHAARLGERIGLSHLYIKDEGLNPTASFKARGLSAAVTMAKALGARTIALPTAGNAGGAAAAYAAKAGLACVIAMPADTPVANIMESRAFGADVRLIDGLISDCGKFIAENKASKRVVRSLHSEGAVSHRRQEDDGLRVVGGFRRKIARRHRLSHRRRCWPDRNVQGFR